MTDGLEMTHTGPRDKVKKKSEIQEVSLIKRPHHFERLCSFVL